MVTKFQAALISSVATFVMTGTAGLMHAALVNIALVPVGDAGNSADTTGYGAVNYNYNIGKYDVTATQYTAFLNAVAATDTYGLYNPSMASTGSGSFGCGITQSGTAGSYTYSTTLLNGSVPVNDVSFWDAARFTNWLQNGQPTGAEGTGTTETGTYTLTSTGIANNTVTRKCWLNLGDNQ